MLLNGCIIIENKTVDQILPIHQAQLMTYMRLRQIKLGFILNWKAPLMKNGIKRMIL
jgi:GxxExxY protein